VGKLYDYHRDNPQLLRLLLWEGLHRGGEAHDIDGWRAEHYVRKHDRAREQFDVDEHRAGLALLALCGVANWTYAVPQTTRLLLGAAADDTETTKQFMQDFARAAMRREPDAVRPVKKLTAEAVRIDAAAAEGASADAIAAVDRDNDDSPAAAVDRAAQRLRDAQAAADAARDELAQALRVAHADGAGANQLARQVAGTLSRPVVLKLLAG
jgi:hypothetical protein